MFLIDESGSTLTILTGSLGYQYTLKASWTNAPFASASIGFYREGGAAVTSTTTSWGAGLGLRHAVRDGHGSLRLEGRAERLGGAGRLERPALVSFGLRLGFDLWL